MGYKILERGVLAGDHPMARTTYVVHGALHNMKVEPLARKLVRIFRQEQQIIKQSSGPL